MVSRLLPLTLLSLAACYSAPPADDSAALDRLYREQARLAGETQTQLLASLWASRSLVPQLDTEPAGITELTARLATLSGQLDELLARLPAPAAAAGPADATAHRHADPTATAVTLLQKGLAANEKVIHVILEDIANVNTAGWKKRQLAITTQVDPNSGLQVPIPGALTTIWTTGALEITERTLDVAIDGEGLFAVIGNDGIVEYTRDGGFQVNVDGKLVTGSGLVVQPEIVVPADTLEISIDPEGRVTCRTAGCPDTTTALGQLTISRFLAPSGLAHVDGNRFRATDGSGPAATGSPGSLGLGLLKQGFLERSNVQMLQELVNLQIAERQRTALRRALAGYGIYVR